MGNKAWNCPVDSSAKVMLVRYAREVPAYIDDIPTNAAMGMLMPESGNTYKINEPRKGTVGPITN